MASPPEPARIPALDAARALGVAAMVLGHTLDALLAPSVRAQPALIAYWKARGFTAPVFMAVAGWAVTVAIQRSGALGWAIPAARWRRSALLYGIGLLLAWPGWGLHALLHGDRAVFAHLAAFGVLQTIGVSILAVSVLFALLPARRARLLALAALALLAVGLGMRAPGHPASWAGIAAEQVIGGTSPFPLFPWMAYFAAGAAVGLWVRTADRRAGLPLAAVGALLVAATCWTGVGTMPAQDPILVAYRIGAFLLLAGLLYGVPASLAARAAPLGRASLGVYAVHVAMVYGWSTHPGLVQRVGPTLGFGRALFAAATVLAVALIARQALLEGLALFVRGAAWARDAAARAFGQLHGG